jgi:hypothetical protein
MKKHLLLIVLIFSVSFVNAQLPGVYSVTIPGWTDSYANGAHMAAADNGHIYIAGRIGKVYKFNGVSIDLFDTLNLGLANNYALDELAGKLAVGRENGLFVYENNAWTKFNTVNSILPANKVTSVKITPDLIFAGTDSGLIALPANALFNTSTSGIIDNRVRCVESLENGTLVIGTFKGLSVFNGATWANYDSTNSQLKNNTIRYIKAAPNNTFWVVTNLYSDTTEINTGYYLFKNGQFITLDNIDGKCDAINVNTFNGYRVHMVDGNGNLIVKLGNSYKKYIHPDNPQIETTFIKNGIEGPYLCNEGVYSTYGFDCFIKGSSLKIYMDTCFTSAHFADSLMSIRAYGTIDINNIESTVFANGTLFNNDENFAENNAPKNLCKSINFKGSLWLTAKDQNGNIRAAAPTHANNSDYFAGPLDTTTAYIDSLVSMAYSKVWKINKSMIMDFQQNYQNGPEYINTEILTWPGNGTGAQAHKLAPFVDLNNNTLYEPLLGDYPELKGDEMLYWIFNDANQHTSSGCLQMGVEIHGMAYAYTCSDINPNSNDEALNNTVFFKYIIFNRGANTFNDFNVAWWQDPDLGRYNDDYVGCDVSRNAAFVYNGVNYDGGPYGYGLNPPMQSYVQLDGPLAPANDGIDNDHDGVFDEQNEKVLFTNFVYYNNDFTITGNPEDCGDIYNYSRSMWKDGSPMVYNGSSGYGSGMPFNYVFPTPPYTQEGLGDSLPPWNEVSAGNYPADRRFIMSCGPTNLSPGENITVEYAIVYSHYDDAPNGASTSFALNNAYVDSITSWYNAQAFPSCYDPTSVIETPAGTGKLNMYPNPATNMVTININGKTDALDFCVTDMAGKTVMCGKGNTINLNSFANGMYLLYAQNSDGVFYTKLIKQ